MYTKNIMSYYSVIKTWNNVVYCGNMYKSLQIASVMLNEILKNRTNVYIFF